MGSRRLRLMKLPDASMTQLALDLAEELDEAGDMQKEIKSMQCEEKDRQTEVMDLFEGLLKRFTELLDPHNQRTKTVHWGSLRKPKGLRFHHLAMPRPRMTVRGHSQWWWRAQPRRCNHL